MQNLLSEWFPYVSKKPELFVQCIRETLVMTLWAGSFMFVFGLFFGVLLTVTREGGILENRTVFQTLDKVINLFRSIPFVILIAVLMNLTKLIMGTRIGVRGVIVPLVFGSVPFFSRQVDSALASVDPGWIEAAQSMGISPIGIIFRVYLREGTAAIARGTTITLINLVGLIELSEYEGTPNVENILSQKVKLEEVNASMTYQYLDDAAACAVNGNYAASYGVDPASAIFDETVDLTNEAFICLIAVRT